MISLKPAPRARLARVALLATITALALGRPAHVPAADVADSAAAKPEPRMGVRSKDNVIARLWIARTMSNKADAYYKYLSQNAAKPLRASSGNLGVQVFRRSVQDTTEFMVISYWTSADAMLQAGFSSNSAQALPRDAEFLLPPGARVQGHSVWLNDIGKLASRPEKPR